MKKLLLFMLVFAGFVSADPGPIHLLKATIDPSQPTVSAACENVPATIDGTALYLAAPMTNFTPEELAELPSLGVRVDGFVFPNAYIIEVEKARLSDLKARFEFSYLGPYLPEYKMTFPDSVAAEGEEKPFQVLIGAVKADYRKVITEKLEAMGISEYELTPGNFEPSVIASVTTGQATELADLPEVRFIEEYEIAMPECNDVRSEAMANVDYLHMEGFRGEGQMICIQDTGLDNGRIADMNPDYTSHDRVIIGRCTTWVANQRGTYDDWSDAGSHGSHVTGCALGNGEMSDGLYRGMAPDASLYVLCAGSSGGGILSGSDEDYEIMYQAGARIMNCSFGSGRGGRYYSSARTDDRLMWDHSDFLICHSAGNYNDCPEEPTSQLNDQAAAKSTIVVGASEKSGYYDGVHQGLAGYSSRGPCADGRMKPDVVIPGSGIMAAGYGGQQTRDRDKYYYSAGGTSMSSPLAAGCCAVIREYLEKVRGVENPRGSLTKAIMIAGCRTLYPGQYPDFDEVADFRPNYMEGHGHVNLRESLTPANGKMDFFECQLARTGAAATNTFEKPADCDLTVSLAWSDYPGTSGAEKAIVNDLDLYVISPNGTVYNRGNHLDTTEILHLGNCEAGTYKVIVKAATIMNGPQVGSVAFTYGTSQRNPKLALANEPQFEMGSASCEICLTNLEENCTLEFTASFNKNYEKVFSFSKTSGSFEKSMTIILNADLTKATSAYPVCEFMINGGQGGAVTRTIGVPVGGEDGYTLFTSRFEGSDAGSVAEEDVAVTEQGGTGECITFMDPVYIDTVFEEDFEGYETDVSVIGQNGWTLAAGLSTNGTTMVKNGGPDGKYLDISRINSSYCPHYKISGLTSKWSEAYDHSYLKFSFKAKVWGTADKSFSLWTPTVGELFFTKYGRKYVIRSGSTEGNHPQYRSKTRLVENEWTDVELWVEVDNDMTKHTLRRIKIGDTVEDCYGPTGGAGNNDYFTILRFYQFGNGGFAFDDLKIERWYSNESREQTLTLYGEPDATSTEDEAGVYFKARMPETHAEDHDFIFDSTLRVSGDGARVIVGQDPLSRQFQSELRCVDGNVKLYLTDLASTPELITDTVPQGEFFRYGYRINTDAGKKTLKRVFFGDKVYTVDKAIDGGKVVSGGAIEDMRIYLPEGGSQLDVANINIRTEAFETPKLFVCSRSFNLGEEFMEWPLTNSYATESITFTARITEGADKFSVEPESGTFNDVCNLKITGPDNRVRATYLWGTIEIDAGSAGKKTMRFGCPSGCDESGYVLYKSSFDSYPEGTAMEDVEANWKCEASTSAVSGLYKEKGFVRFAKERNSSLPITEQGAFCQVGLPEGIIDDLPLTISCQLRFPEDFKGYFYYTQDEPHRQFQSAFTTMSTGGQKYVKVTLTDYLRNTGLFTNKTPLGSFFDYSFEISFTNSVKYLDTITFADTTKDEGRKITGTKISESDGVDSLCFRLTYDGTYVDVRDLTVSIGPYIPEPGTLVLILALLGLPCLRKYLLI